ncbi:MAG: FecR domain-containing protein [Verrucomicrobiota bacterium]
MKNQMLFVVFFLICCSTKISAKDFKVVDGSGEIGKSPRVYQAAEVPKLYPLNWWARTSSRPLKVEFSPENVFRLLPKSEVQITGTGAATTRFRRVVKLKAGSVDVDLKNLQGSKVEVETPTAICGAVGTEFVVNADEGSFKVTEGRVSAKAKKDSGFQAKSVSGSFTLAPGSENAYSKVNVTGDFSLNGISVNGGRANVSLAKARGGTGQAAVRVHSGSFAGASSGAYVMDGGKLQAISDPKLATVHRDYVSTASKEGSLNLKKEGLRAQGKSVPSSLETELRATAKKATELRKRLFTRSVIRDTAKDNARDVLRQQQQTNRPRM